MAARLKKIPLRDSTLSRAKKCENPSGVGHLSGWPPEEAAFWLITQSARFELATGWKGARLTGVRARQALSGLDFAALQFDFFSAPASRRAIWRPSNSRESWSPSAGSIPPGAQQRPTLSLRPPPPHHSFHHRDRHLPSPFLHNGCSRRSRRLPQGHQPSVRSHAHHPYAALRLAAAFARIARRAGFTTIHHTPLGNRLRSVAARWSQHPWNGDHM